MNASSSSLSDILAAEEAARKEWEATTLHGGYSVAALRSAFEHSLAPGQNWKDPIRVLAETQEEAARLVAGIEYFVGGPSTITPREFNRGGKKVALLVVENQGYYRNIGA